MTIKKKHTRLIDPKGFDEAFLEEIPNWETHEQAYDYLEAQYIIAFGGRRYKNYESFRVSRLVRLRRKLKKAHKEAALQET